MKKRENFSQIMMRLIESLTKALQGKKKKKETKEQYPLWI